MTVPIEGLAALDAQLAEFTRLVVEEAAPAGARAGAGVIFQAVADRAPVRTGALKASLEEVAEEAKTSATVAVSVADSQKGGDEWKAVLLEHGTSRMPPHPFARPAFEASKDAAAQAAAVAIQQTISS